MRRFLLERAVFALILVLVVPPLGFLLMTLAPGDATYEAVLAGTSAPGIARERDALHLDRSSLSRLGQWARGALRFDFGTSYRYQRPVAPLVAERAANTAILGVTALAVATIIGIPFGVLGANHRVVRGAIATGSTILLSLPPLVLALLLAYVAARTEWLPVGGMSDPLRPEWLPRSLDLARHLVVPAASLALPMAARLERLQARALGDTLGRPFVLAALARGLSQRRVLWRHAVPHALISVVAVYGLVVASLLSGSLAVEIVTAWPGLGRLTYEALVSRDAALAAGCATAAVMLVAVATLVSDVALAVIDPRLGEHE
jgi:peptide/nickel transport system permease protein